MKKSDLKTGMLIVDREGKRGMVMLGTEKGDNIVSDGEDDRSYKPLDRFNDDLIYSNEGNLSETEDITQVWSYSSNEFGCTFNLTDRKLLWSRK